MDTSKTNLNTSTESIKNNELTNGNLLKIKNYTVNVFRRPRYIAFVYLMAIPVFGILYWFMANQFYQATASVEGNYIGLTKQTETALLEVVNKWFEYLEQDKHMEFPGFRDVSITGLTTSEQILTFHTSFTRSVPRSTGRASYRPKWELEFPPITDSVNSLDLKSVRLFVRITNLPSSITVSLFNYPPANPWQDRFWGPIREHVTQNADTGESNGVIDGFITIPKSSFEIVERYRDSRLGSPAVLDGGFVRFLYLSAVTITTLGYGDIVPLTTTARILVGFESVFGIVMAGIFLNSLTYKRTYNASK